jgi:UPF0755 protein
VGAPEDRRHGTRWPVWGAPSRAAWARRVGGVLLACILAVTAVRTAALALGPADPTRTTPVLVDVRPGMRLGEIAALLRRRGLVRSAWAFRLLALQTGVARRLQAGTYALDPAMTPRQILDTLASGRVVVVRVVVPEGADVRQVLAALAQAGIGQGPALAAAAHDAALLTAAGLPPPGPGVRTALEGYLFPATYAFAPDVGVSGALTAMLQRFRAAWTPQLQAAARANAGLDTVQAVTLASIVQREVGDPAAMATVAGIYLNRLRQGMKLDADPTVLYALGIQGQDGPLTEAELRVDSPYNTYLHPGLPPGPICNPGLQALEAVAHPAHTTALYFLTTPDGRLVLARTLAEQLANRKAYLGY